MMISEGPTPSELKKEAQKRKFELIEKFWGSVDRYARFKEYIARRKEFLQRLYQIYPYIEFQAANWDESVRTEWFGYGHAADDFIGDGCAPIIHYKVLPCELVFDLETKEKDQLVALVKALRSFGVMPFIATSGNRGFHLHVLFTSEKYPIEQFAEASDLPEFRGMLFEYVIESAKNFGLKGEVVDSGVVKSSAHLIRSVYSYNPKGRQWKKPVYGEFYPIWKIPKGLFLDVRDYIARKREQKLIEELINEELSSEKKVERRSRGPNKVKWIEKILQAPEKVCDGRKRLLLHVIIPYLVTVKGIAEDEVIAQLSAWIERTGAQTSKYRSFIRCQVKLVKRKKLLPMRREKFFGMYPDLIKKIEGI